MTEAIVQGLCTSSDTQFLSHLEVVLSPRSKERSTALALQFRACQVADSNQQVVDTCDWVVLGVLPQHAEQILPTITFKAGQTIVSLLPRGLVDVRPLVAPATEVVSAIPLPPVARHLGPTAIFPPHKEVEALFARISLPVPVNDIVHLRTLQCATALLAPYYGLLDSVATWMQLQGVDQATASKYIGALFHANTVDALKVDGDGYRELCEESVTVGGLNEQVLRELRDTGAYQHWTQALDHVFERLTPKNESS
eukprot:CAMPEP_0197865988 /NCGR_PEP_ID=MMETSP1438-20131217/43969_1 /TAXON_ID=1461541 /ORGANISM="Pterosperma sp., Strain CCMP1384" /LENGTH=253 /DNA_ID=CAMNT_0043484513 /DNA_START=510 /DNA_END=1271 /DNA_ORIENTATION=+